jgi:hypothetical protein
LPGLADIAGLLMSLDQPGRILKASDLTVIEES